MLWNVVRAFFTQALPFCLQAILLLRFLELGQSSRGNLNQKLLLLSYCPLGIWSSLSSEWIHSNVIGCILTCEHASFSLEGLMRWKICVSRVVCQFLKDFVSQLSSGSQSSVPVLGGCHWHCAQEWHTVICPYPCGHVLVLLSSASVRQDWKLIRWVFLPPPPFCPLCPVNRMSNRVSRTL